MIPKLPESEHPDDFRPFAAELRKIARAVFYGSGDPDWVVELATISPDQPAEVKALTRFRVHCDPWIRRPGQEPVRIVFEGEAPFGESSIRISYYALTELPYFDHLYETAPAKLGTIIDQG